MPIIRIDWDDEKLNNDEILALSNAVQKIVSEATGIEDVFVYANSSQIKIKIAPVEIFIEMSAHAIKDESALIKTIRENLSEWKRNSSFQQPINLTLIPMNWKIEINI